MARISKNPLDLTNGLGAEVIGDLTIDADISGPRSAAVTQGFIGSVDSYFPLGSAPFAVSGTMAGQSRAPDALATLSSLPMTGATSLSINDTADHVINAAESTAVAFTVSGLNDGSTGIVTFSDGSNHQVVVDVNGNGTFSADLSGLTDGTVTSSLSAAGSAGVITSTAGNSVALDTDSGLNPSLSVDATNPAHTVFTVSGLEGDETGTVTFTDASGHQDVVPIASNGAYSANLSNLTDGTVTYLLSASDPAGNVVTVDPPLNLGDGSANAPTGTAQFSHLLDVNSSSTQAFGETLLTRPSWNVAGVDYAVGIDRNIYPTDASLQDPLSGPGGTLAPALVALGCTYSNNTLTIYNDNTVIQGWDFSLHGGIMLELAASPPDPWGSPNGVIIRDNKIMAPAGSSTAIGAGTNASNVTITDNIIEGNPSGGSTTNGLIALGSFGNNTITYNLIENAWAEDLTLASVTTSPVNYTIQYNVIANCGIGEGPTNQAIHGDWVQFQVGSGDVFNSVNASYNTWIQSLSGAAGPTKAGGQGITWAPEGQVNSQTYTNNTIVVAPSAVITPAFMGYDLTWQKSTTITDNFQVNPGGTMTLNWNGGGPLNGTVTTANNVDMTTGSYFGQTVTSVRQVTSSPTTGTEFPGNTVTLTLNFSAAVTVTGTPKLTLNDGGTATYTGGSGTNALTFTYTVGASDSSVANLAITAVNLPTGTTINDAGGNAANLTDALTTLWGLAIDPPTSGAPVISSFSPDSGVVGDHITNATILTLTGSAVANSTVNVYDGATLLGTAAANSSGAWSFATKALANGPHSFTATDTVSSATSAASSALSVTIDTVAPTTPLISSNSVSPTNVVTLSGTAEANSTVTVFDGTTQLGTATTNSSGAWSFATAALSAGSHSFTAKDTDAAGNTSAASSSMNVTLNGPAPTIASFSPDSGVLGDHITNATILTLTGSAVANSTVNVYDGATLLGTAAANSSGAWSFATKALANGAHSFTATDTVSSATSAASSALSVTVDTVAPTTPVINSNSVSTTDVVTLSGTAEANSTVTVFDGTTQLGTATTNSSGAWSFATAALSAGSHSFTAKDTDAAGNVSAASSALNLTLTAPTAPVNLVTNGSFETGDLTGWQLGGNYTSGYFGPEIFAVGQAQSGQYAVGLGPVGSDGTLSQTLQTTAGLNYTLSFWLANQGSGPNDFTVKWNGANVMALANVSAQGYTQYTFTVKATGASSVLEFDARQDPSIWNLDSISVTANAPSAPTVATFSPDSGVVGDQITNASILTLTGSAVANSTVNVYDGATLLGTAAANSSGAWSFATKALANGPHSFTATDTVLGITGAASSALSLTVDTVAPNAPVIASDAIINANEVNLTGTAEANSTIKVYDGITFLGSATANGSGAWTYTTSALSNGPHAFTATATDAAGNTSLGSQLVNPIIGTVATIEAVGSTSLVEIGSNFYLDSVSSGQGPSLKVSGVDVGAGQYGSWTPIGAEQTATGYEVAWKVAGADQYAIWSTDSNGNYISTSNVVSGTSSTLEAFEVSFHQDLNGDGIIGVGTTTIESDGSTSLVEVGNSFFLDSISSGSGPSLKVGGVDVGVGQFASWTPIGAEQTATGYEVAWQVAGTDKYAVWTTDSNGNFISTSNVVSGTSSTLEAFEASFHQDLNGDGIIGLPSTTIESNGSTSLVEVGNNFFLDSISSGSGPSLKVGGTAVTVGQFGSWTPIGTEQTSSGYEITWKLNGVDQFSVWTTDSNGNYISTNGIYSGTSPTLQSLETSFHQDLNGDGVIATTLLDGHLGNQTLSAGSAPTSLFGGSNDILNGGAGADVFVFQPNFGSNMINGFKVGADALEFSQSTFASAAAVLSHAQQVGSDVVISADPLNVVTLHNTLLTNLHVTDIHIV